MKFIITSISIIFISLNAHGSDKFLPEDCSKIFWDARDNFKIYQYHKKKLRDALVKKSNEANEHKSLKEFYKKSVTQYATIYHAFCK